MRTHGFVQQSTNGNGFAATGFNSAGVKLLTVLVSENNSNGTVTDNQGNTYTNRVRVAFGGNDYVTLWDCINPTTGASHVISISGTGNLPAICVQAFDDAITGFDQSNGAAGLFPPIQPGSITPTGASVIIAGYRNSTGADTVDSGFATPVLQAAEAPGQSVGVGGSYLIQSSPAAVNPEFNTSLFGNVAVIGNYLSSGGGTDPTLTSVGTDDVVQYGETSVPWVGTLMGTTNADRRLYFRQGTVEVDQPETGTGTATSATSGPTEIIGATGSDGDLKFGAGFFGVERLADNEIGERAGTMNPPTGQQYVDLVSPGSGAGYITAVGALVTGDQLQMSGAGSAGTSPAPSNLVVAANASFSFPTGSPANFDCRAWDSAGTPPKWGAWATQNADPDVTVSLTGQSVAASAGTMGNTHARALTGQAVTSAAGTLTPARSIAVTGQALTVSRGTLALTHANALTGQAITASRGTLVPALTLSVTGLSVTASLGTVAAAIARALTGLSVAISQGTITTGSNVTVALTGQALNTAAGSVGLTHANALAGAAVTASLGALSPTLARALTGQALTTATGTLALTAALQLVGAVLTTAAGNITANAGGNVTVALTGQAMTAALGTLSAAHANALTGGAITAAPGTLTPAHAAALAGQSVNLSPGTVATLRALALLGIPCTISAGTVTPQQGANVTVNLTGLVMAVQAGALGKEIAVTLGGVEMAAAQGAVRAIVPPTGGSGTPTYTVAGSFADRNPWAVELSTGQPANVAGPNGCILGRFAWLSADGKAANARLAPDDRLGFALMQAATWGTMYWSAGRPVLRAGMPITVLASGDLWALFPNGAEAGARVYARVFDGVAVAGYAAECEATPWTVATSTGPGGLAVITTYR